MQVLKNINYIYLCPYQDIPLWGISRVNEKSVSAAHFTTDLWVNRNGLKKCLCVLAPLPLDLQEAGEMGLRSPSAGSKLCYREILQPFVIA